MSTHNSLIFTICSANYLAQAITLGHSVKNTNPDIFFRIYLVDRLEGREEIRDMVPFPIIEIEKVPIEDFEGMILRYNIVELNTAVKPYIFHHIFSDEPHINKIIYLDPDIMVFQPFNKLLSNLDTFNLVLTPHILTPSDNDKNVPQESSFLATGIYNLGFLAIKKSEESYRFLKWWEDKLLYQAYARHHDHLFYDQKWLNFATIYFDDVYVEKSNAYNMAPWNLHERDLYENQGTFFVNNKEPLVFFHFSSFKSEMHENISSHTSYTIKMRPDLKSVFEMYRTQLLNNGEIYYQTQVYSFNKYKNEILRNQAFKNSNALMKKVRKIKYYFQKYFQK